MTPGQTIWFGWGVAATNAELAARKAEMRALPINEIEVPCWRFTLLARDEAGGGSGLEEEMAAALIAPTRQRPVETRDSKCMLVALPPSGVRRGKAEEEKEKIQSQVLVVEKRPQNPSMDSAVYYQYKRCGT